ncbi:hypothetical protein PIB30_006736 [Stylosanthes scabra]|uniref:Uncharacterized protein n=1 Tax=Stylosanthes scabra TaxID=79078 RepID=A0ABU6T4M8_9FABA|nr:hypothetical protein [Stylosanthes scabra]
MAQTKTILALFLLASMLLLCEWFHYYSSIERTSGSVDSAVDDDDGDNMWCLPPLLDDEHPWHLAVRLRCNHLQATLLMDLGHQHSVVFHIVFKIPFHSQSTLALLFA